MIRSLLSLLLAVILASLAACTRDEGPPPTSSQATAPALTRVEDPSQVCMVNNQFMGKPQIPVEIEGKTYFGCCAMCKGRLETDRSARIARDPVTGEEVDKAAAVIAQDSQGAVLYFASAESLARYRPAP